VVDNNPVISRRVIIPNKHGIHVRTAAQIAECCEAFDANIIISNNHGESDGTDMMRLMMLQASQGTELIIHATGDEAAQALSALEQLITQGFDSLEE
jgi:phosphocarrier protein